MTATVSAFVGGWLSLDSMTAAELQETFGISRADWRRVATDPGMPEPMDPKYTQGETMWSSPGFVRWLAAEYPDLAHLTPHLLRPTGRMEAKYIGGLYGKGEPTLREEYFAGHWRTGYGRLAVVYPRHHAFRGAAAAFVAGHPKPAPVVVGAGCSFIGRRAGVL